MICALALAGAAAVSPVGAVLAEAGGGTSTFASAPGEASPEPTTVASKWIRGAQESADGPRWHYSILRTALPSDWQVLIEALEAHAETGRTEFLKDVQGSEDEREWTEEWALEFREVARSASFVTVEATDYRYGGGVHGNYGFTDYTWFRPDDRLVELDDLLELPKAARLALRDEVRRRLFDDLLPLLVARDADEEAQARELTAAREWIERGTMDPQTALGTFRVIAQGEQTVGIEFVFEPYQIAAYAHGPQYVEIPSAFLRPLLKAEYRDVFVDLPLE